MGKILNIVERAYQGTLEEQDDQALWLVHALKNAGMEQTVLLRGPGTAYAVNGQGVGTLTVAGKRAGNPGKMHEDLQRLSEKGVEILVVDEDATERGIEASDLIPEARMVARAEVPQLMVDAERIFAW